jgi:hypothetical protein
MRGLDNDVTQRRKDARGTVWMLSKLTTHGVGTPSSLGVSSSSDTRPRCVLVRAATTTEPMRSATGSRVSTSTGRSPLGVAANQISPRCIAPITPILGRPPVGDLLQRALGISKRHLAPSLDVVLSTQAHQVPMKSVAQDLRALHPQRFRPTLNLCSFSIRDTKTKHRHTRMLSRMTLLARTYQRARFERARASHLFAAFSLNMERAVRCANPTIVGAPALDVS